MTSFPGSPRLIKSGIVLMGAETGVVQRIIMLQGNMETLTLTLQVQGASTEGGDRSEALYLKGPPVETLNLTVELAAADRLGSALAEAA